MSTPSSGCGYSIPVAHPRRVNALDKHDQRACVV